MTKASIVYLDTALRDKLNAYAIKEGRTAQWVLNTAVRRYLENPGAAWPEEKEVTPTENSTDEPTPFDGTEWEEPCCKQQKPCRHWSFDGNEGCWVNSISGRTKSAVMG